MHMRFRGMCTARLDLWKPPVATEPWFPLSTLFVKIGSLTEPGGQQLGIITDQ